MNRVGLCLEPLDVLFFRDGRSFDAASKVVSGLPTPQVLAGAVRTALLEKCGCDFAALRDSTRAGKSFAGGLPESIRWIAGVRFRGPWLCALPASDGATAADVFLPAPATVHTRKKGEEVEGGPNVFLLKPLAKDALPGWRGDKLPLWLDNTIATEPASGFIRKSGLDAFLAGRAPDKGELVEAGKLYDHDTRTGIGIDGAKLVAADGEIYGIRFLSLKRKVQLNPKEPDFDVGFYAEIDLPDGAPAGAMASIPFLAFGGEGKRVAVRAVPTFPFPEPPPCGPNQKRFVLLTTPARTDDGKRYEPAGCVAAAVGTAVAISGWDIAKNGPKPTRFASPAGSVYFLESTANVAEPPDEFGYGCHLQGVWNDARDAQ